MGLNEVDGPKKGAAGSPDPMRRLVTLGLLYTPLALLFINIPRSNSTITTVNPIPRVSGEDEKINSREGSAGKDVTKEYFGTKLAEIDFGFNFHNFPGQFWPLKENLDRSRIGGFLNVVYEAALKNTDMEPGLMGAFGNEGIITPNELVNINEIGQEQKFSLHAVFGSGDKTALVVTNGHHMGVVYVSSKDWRPKLIGESNKNLGPLMMGMVGRKFNVVALIGDVQNREDLEARLNIEGVVPKTMLRRENPLYRIEVEEISGGNPLIPGASMEEIKKIKIDSYQTFPDLVGIVAPPDRNGEAFGIVSDEKGLWMAPIGTVFPVSNTTQET